MTKAKQARWIVVQIDRPDEGRGTTYTSYGAFRKTELINSTSHRPLVFAVELDPTLTVLQQSEAIEAARLQKRREVRDGK
jgi:hypothetical protein